MGWTRYRVAFEATFLVDCHGGPTEVEEEALFEDARGRLQAVINTAAREVMQDPKYARLLPEWEGGAYEV